MGKILKAKSRKIGTNSSGFTLLEVLIVAAFAIILTVVLVSNFVNKKSSLDLDTATKEMVTLLREAQSRSIAQEGGVVWGVHFDNSSTSPFFALFSGTYSSSTEVSHYKLPTNFLFATSSIAQGSSLNITFSQVSGAPSTSTSISLNQTAGGTSATPASVSRTGSGKIFFDDFTRTNL